MIDPYVLLTPILMLGVLALIRFVGCNWWFDIEETQLVEEEVEGLLAKAGDSYVLLTWGYTTGMATKFVVHYGPDSGGPYSTMDVLPSGSYEHSKFVPSLSNGTTYYFKVQVVTANNSSDINQAVEVSAQPHVTDFLTVTSPGANRQDFDGWVGMAILVRAEPIIVTQLGRWAVITNASAHDVRIVEASSNQTVAMVTVPPGTAGGFTFVQLSARAELLPGGLYYVVSQESAGGDPFLNYPTLVEPLGQAMNMNVAKVLASVYSNMTTPDNFILNGNQNETYGPLNFRY